MPASAWESSIVKCEPCKAPGCQHRALRGSDYCCKRCNLSVDPEFDASGVLEALDGHEPDCSRMDQGVLRRSWWELFRCDQSYHEDAACLVVPPDNFERLTAPAPVLLFLTGNGHVNDKEDFFWGGVDALLRNSEIRSQFFVLAPKPTTNCGLLAYTGDGWKKVWAEEAVWALYTEVLRRLGPSRADPARLYATGYSLGAAGIWHLAIAYGEFLAAVVPISGGCEWPGHTWRGGAPDPAVLAKLEGLAMRAYQIDLDIRAGNPERDMSWMCWQLEEEKADLCLRGVDPGTTVEVKVRRWPRQAGAVWEVWLATGPLSDHAAWTKWGGDRHCLWTRAYPFAEWDMARFLLQQSVPQDRQWRFDSPALVVDTTEYRRQLDAAWAKQAAEAAAAAAAAETAEEVTADAAVAATQASSEGGAQNGCTNGVTKGSATAVDCAGRVDAAATAEVDAAGMVDDSHEAKKPRVGDDSGGAAAEGQVSDVACGS